MELSRRVPDHVRAAALRFPERVALRDEKNAIRYSELVPAMAGVAHQLADQGVSRGDVVAICAFNSVAYGVAYLAVVAMGAVAAPLPQSASPDSLRRMVTDSGARAVMVDDATASFFANAPVVTVLTLGTSRSVDESFDWPALAPEDSFNIIYSSGTTGTPKGIEHSHAMRDNHVALGETCGYEAGCITLLSTPLYSNTTLISFLPTLALGGTVVLMRKFDVTEFLATSERLSVTHTMLVPIQYQRLLAFDRFDDFDLSSYRQKFCTSAPFAPELKQAVLNRWPGKLTEFYGMTEGGGLCILAAHDHPDKLHTVGRPAPNSDVRMIDEHDIEVSRGAIGEVVGASATFMSGYHNQADATKAAIWTSPEGRCFMRTGDIGRFDEDGFLILMDRKKDVIISGGFNIYPSDLEEIIRLIPGVEDAAVVGVPSDAWGETPVGFVTGHQLEAADVMSFVNARVGKSQRLADLVLVDALPRSPIGKVLKRDLRDSYGQKAL